MNDLRSSILTRIGKHRLTPNGWISCNAVCCHHNGETRDKRGRGGLIFDPDGNFTWSCFNCGFKARFETGRVLSKNMKKLLTWIGFTTKEIQDIRIANLKKRKITDMVVADRFSNAVFIKHKLPSDSRSLILTDTRYIDYIENRGLKYTDYDFHITPDGVGRHKNRIIIPYMYKGAVVGWTSRFMDHHLPKYKNEHQQPGYVFGVDFQQHNWDYGIVCEGIFDALSIKGMAVLHSEMSEKQITILRQLHKEIIVVPDQDTPGLRLITQAMELGFSVSIPDWGDDADGKPIHDINEAVAHYGKLNTLLSILKAKGSNKISITIMQNKLKRKL